MRAHLPDKHAFEPAEIEAMSRAFREICTALNLFAGDTYAREIVATRIIDLARAGMTDADAIRSRVLAESKAVA